MVFSELIVAYLFLGGCGGGGCAVCSALGLLSDGDDVRRGLACRFRDGCGRLYARLFGAGFTISLIAQVLGIVSMLADVGRPDRVLLLAASSPANYLVLGFWSLTLCGLCALALALVWTGLAPARLWAFRTLHGLALVAGLACALYTGLLLSGMPAVPLWNTPWLVAVFLLSSISCGMALLLLAGFLSRATDVFGTVLRRVANADSWVIVVEALCVAGWLLAVSAAGGADTPTPTDVAALASFRQVIEGAQAPWFWIGLAGFGLVVPLVLEILGRIAPSQIRTLVAAACVLAGGAILRYVTIAAAVQPMAASPF